jgi:aryl-alcohol dehydrogenase-like predicted oxidoreductase
VITGASRVSQVHENMKALEFVDRFTPDLMAEIAEIVA